MSGKIFIVNKKTFKKKYNSLFKKKLCYYLINDYYSYLEIIMNFDDSIRLKSLDHLFNKKLEIIKEDYTSLMYSLSIKYSSNSWWGSIIASKNVVTTPLLQNIIYLLCARDIMDNANEDIVFIVESDALKNILKHYAEKKFFKVYSQKKILKLFTRLFFYPVKLFLKSILYFFICLKRKVITKFYLKDKDLLKNSKKNILLRSWVTIGNFAKSNSFANRNFGELDSLFEDEGYRVWNLPMYFNLSIPYSQIIKNINNYKENFIVPEQYLKYRDFLINYLVAFKHVFMKFKNIRFHGFDISSLFTETKRSYGFSIDLAYLNSCYYLMKRLKQKGIQFDKIFYPYENNPSEKLFICGVKKYYQEVKLCGYQHTVFYNNQLAFYISKNEDNVHPLPDEIICGGPIYLKLYNDSGIPDNILKRGANLRFSSVYLDEKDLSSGEEVKEKSILIPLTCSYEFAFDTIFKVKKAVESFKNFKVLIRNHPLLSKKKIVDFINLIELKNYEFADDGIVQDYFSRVTAVVSGGGTVVDLEAVVMGVPLIQVVPDNTAYLKCFIWDDYIFKPVNTYFEIQEQLKIINKKLNENSNYFTELGDKVKNKYFEKLDSDNKQVFLV